MRRLSEWFGFSLKRKPVKLFVLHFPHRAGIQVCIDERVAALSFFWGDPSEFVPAAHAAGIAVLHQVGSVEAAVRAQQAGVDVIIAQGVEAGGHVAGEVSPWCFLRTRFVREWVDRETETQDSRSDEPVIGHTVIGGAEIPIQRFVSMPPNIHATGDIKLMSLLAGQSVRLVDEILPAAEILRETVNGAERLIRELSAKVHESGRA